MEQSSWFSFVEIGEDSWRKEGSKRSKQRSIFGCPPLHPTSASYLYCLWDLFDTSFPCFCYMFSNKSLKIGSLCIGFPGTGRFFCLLRFSRPPWSWRWRGPGTYPARRCCASPSPLPGTPPAAPCCSPPSPAAVSRPPGAAGNSSASERRRAFVNNSSQRGGGTRTDTYMGFLAIVGEVHLIEARLAGEILDLCGAISLSRRAVH